MSHAFAGSRTPIRLPVANLITAAIIGVLLVSAIVYVGATRLGASLRLAGASADPNPIELRIGAYAMTVPENVVRFPEQRTTQRRSEVDLYLEWPSLAGFSEASEAVFHDPEARGLLFLRLTLAGRKDGDRDVSASPASPATGPAGLDRSTRVGLPGIASQEAVYRSPPGREPPFEASCLDGRDAVMAADCIRDVAIAPGLWLRYRFSHALLPQWDRIDRAVLAYIAEHRKS